MLIKIDFMIFWKKKIVTTVLNRIKLHKIYSKEKEDGLYDDDSS